MNIVEKALLVANTAHSAVGQVRKYTGEPYIVHPIAVMRLVKTVEHKEEMLAAALLHDVIEDTHITREYINKNFNIHVGILVDGLTQISNPKDGNRAFRKRKDADFLANSRPSVQTIKYADLIDNMKSIIVGDPDFARIFVAEKKYLLEVMDKGNPRLRRLAMTMVDNYYENI